DLLRDAAILVEQGRQYMLNFDLAVVILLRQFIGFTERFTCFVGKSLNFHRYISQYYIFISIQYSILSVSIQEGLSELLSSFALGLATARVATTLDRAAMEHESEPGHTVPQTASARVATTLDRAAMEHE